MAGLRWRISGGHVLAGDGLDLGTISIDGDELAEPGTAQSGARSIDASGLVVSPGFVDVQINGGFGVDLQTDPAAMWALGSALVETGVTSFLPTLISSSPNDEQEMFSAFDRKPTTYRGATPLGIHFEGPMLSPGRAGAHQRSALRPPTEALIEGWTADRGAKLVTLAPELPGAIDVIRRLVDDGVTVAAGHSLATVAEAEAAIAAGLSGVTHLFNAMAPMSHRSPNLVGVALTSPTLLVSVIVDGVHVDPIAVQLAWKSVGSDRFILVSDAVAPMGQPAGEYEFAGGVVVSDGVAVRNGDGVLAGSVLTMPTAINNLRAFTGCTLVEALCSASRNPATLIGESRRGHLDPGAIADVVLLDEDEDGQVGVVMTICAGELVHVAPGHEWRVDV